jgi:hypothetical protein
LGAIDCSPILPLMSTDDKILWEVFFSYFQQFHEMHDDDRGEEDEAYVYEV